MTDQHEPESEIAAVMDSIAEYADAPSATAAVEPYTGDPGDERDRLKPGGDMTAVGVSMRGHGINGTGRTAYEILHGLTYAAFGQPEPSRRESALDHVLAAVALAGAAAPNRLAVNDGITALIDLGVTADELAASRNRITRPRA